MNGKPTGIYITVGGVETRGPGGRKRLATGEEKARLEKRAACLRARKIARQAKEAK